MKNQPPQMNDEEIVNAIKQGGRVGDKALGFIMQSFNFKKGIYTFLSLRRVSPEDINDIYVEGITELYFKVYLKEFELDGSLKAYLFGICRNIWRNKLKKRTRFNIFRNLWAQFRPLTSDPEKTQNEMEYLDKVLEEIEKLGTPYKDILLLRALGYSYEEISEELQKTIDKSYSPVVLRQYAKRAREKLHENIANSGWSEDFLAD